MQKQEANLEFVINSSADVDDVVLVARLSAEFKDYALTKNDLAFEVNGEEVAYSTTINLTEDGPFADFTISTESFPLSLQRCSSSSSADAILRSLSRRH